MFEKEFSDYTKIKFSTTVVNGTLALDLALSMLLVASCHAGALPAELWPQIVVIAVISINPSNLDLNP